MLLLFLFQLVLVYFLAQGVLVTTNIDRIGFKPNTTELYTLPNFELLDKDAQLVSKENLGGKTLIVSHYFYQEMASEYRLQENVNTLVPLNLLSMQKYSPF